MAESNFIDYVKIHCMSGPGGAGSTHMLRTKGNAKGGPDGGDGGRGGHIILRGNAQMWTLLHLKYRKHIKAEPGGGETETIESELPVKTSYCKYPWVPSLKTLKPVNF